MAQLRFDGQVAIVTGAGRGLGRHFALALAARGARVVVNGRGSVGGIHEASVVDEIRAHGGEAIAVSASVTDPLAVQAMVDEATARWGGIDLLVNNAGFVRDQSFARLSADDFRAVLDVHLMGAVHCTRAVWRSMLDRRAGRVVMITSSSGLAGNFGQAAYAAAKMALVGLANTLGIEGEARNVRVNCLAPIGTTEMNAGILPPALQQVFSPEKVLPALLHLLSPAAPNRAVLLAGGGSFERAHVGFTRGQRVEPCTPEALAAAFEAVSDRTGDMLPRDAAAQLEVECRNLGMSPGGAST